MVSSGTETRSAGVANLQFFYDAPSGRYFVSEGARAQSFGAGDIDPAGTNAQVATYTRTDGITTDNLTLVKNGGFIGTTRYVSAGFWQRQVDGAVTKEGFFDAFTYGVQTPNSAMPRTGAASYNLQLLGGLAEGTNIAGLRGSGRMDVAFDSGAIYSLVNVEAVDPMTGSVRSLGGLRATGLIATGTNAFSGTASIGGLPNATSSTFQGSFYGPAAEEIGATFSVSGGGTLAVGALWGPRGTQLINRTDDVGPVIGSPAIHAAQGSSFRASVDAFGVTAAATESPIVARYRLEQGVTGLLYRTAQSGVRAVHPWSGSGHAVEETGLSGEYTRPATVRAGLMYEDAGPSQVFDAYVYGLPSPIDAIPRAGKAVYDATIGGGIAEPTSKLLSLSGNGQLTANLATGSLTGAGNYAVRTFNPSALLAGGPTLVYSGTWLAAATIANGSNAVAGTFALDGGLKDYSGTLDAQFYGSAANKLGGTFALTSASGGRAAGFLLAEQNIEATNQANFGLLKIDTRTPLLAMTSEASYETDLATGVSVDKSQPTSGRFHQVVVDPSSTTAKYGLASGGRDPFIQQAFGEDHRSSVLSDASRQVYVKDVSSTGTSGSKTAQLTNYTFDGAGGRIALSYTGFFTYTEISTVAGLQRTDTIFGSYGRATPVGEMPRNGSASYSGVAFGQAVLSGSTTGIYELTGTSSLYADFTRGEVSGKIALSGPGTAGEPVMDFDSVSFVGGIIARPPAGMAGGDVGGFSLPTVAGPGPLQGYVDGTFYGPAAREVGGAFDLTYNLDGTSGTVHGGFVARSAP